MALYPDDVFGLAIVSLLVMQMNRRPSAVRPKIPACRRSGIDLSYLWVPTHDFPVTSVSNSVERQGLTICPLTDVEPHLHRHTGFTSAMSLSSKIKSSDLSHSALYYFHEQTAAESRQMVQSPATGCFSDHSGIARVTSILREK